MHFDTVDACKARLRLRLCTQDEEECLASAKLVGSTLTKDPYGIVLPQGHDVFDKLKVATIETLLDLDFMDGLQLQYFPEASNEDAGQSDAATSGPKTLEWKFVSAPPAIVTLPSHPQAGRRPPSLWG